MFHAHTNSPRCRLRHALAALFAAAAAGVITLAAPSPADAFCGFYVSQSEGSLYNNATRVAMMRDDQQTVMSMQNNYAGPAEDFAMVVPVPEVLEKKQVKTLEDRVFERLDRLTSPRLVEYWQNDPCYEPRERRLMAMEGRAQADADASRGGGGKAGEKVTVEAKFDVGEYQVVVLSAEESTALDTWLRNNEYDIPDGAEQYFQPYIEQGSYFFVAKVDLEKVEYADGQALLSPIRFHYESDDFKLPVRLGLINSKGSQDLIVYLLGRRQRYEVANYPNVRMPTNLPVDEGVKGRFGAFYDTLFERVVEDRPRAVVTEYAWTATNCDPCPVQPLEPGHLQTLGGDVLSEDEGDSGSGLFGNGNRRPRPTTGSNWTVTRLHTRYSKESLGQDLVFEKAHPITGGRGEPEGGGGEMDHQTARRASRNNYQARYYIRHFWSGDADCEDPNWGRWGGPPNGSRPDPSAAGDLGISDPTREVSLDASIQQESIPKLGALSAGRGGNGAGNRSSNSNSSDDERSEREERGDDEDVDLDETVEQDDIPNVDDE